MKILIIEPVLTGHHSNYLKNLSLGAVKNGYKVTIATSSIHQNSQLLAWASNIKDIVIDFSENLRQPCISSPTLFNLIRRELIYYYTFNRLYKGYLSSGIDIVLIPYVDYCLNAIALFGSPFGKTQWKCITMRPSFHHSSLGISSKQNTTGLIKKFLFKRFIQNSSLLKAYTIDPSLHAYCTSHWNHHAEKLEYLPDPIEDIHPIDKKEARQRLGIQNDKCVILVYGALSMRKGVQKLLPFLTHPLCDPNFHLLLIGQTDAEFRTLLNNDAYHYLINNSRCTLYDLRASAEFQDVVFSAADVSWLGYHNHDGMSGVLILSEKYGLPSLVCNSGLLGWLNTKYSFGPNSNELLENMFRATAIFLEYCRDRTRNKKDIRSETLSLHNWNYVCKIVFN